MRYFWAWQLLLLLWNTPQLNLLVFLLNYCQRFCFCEHSVPIDWLKSMYTHRGACVAPDVAMEDVHSASSRCIQQRALPRFSLCAFSQSCKKSTTVRKGMAAQWKGHLNRWGLPVDLLCMLLQTIALLSHWEHWNDFNLGPVFHSLVIYIMYVTSCIGGKFESVWQWSF